MSGAYVFFVEGLDDIGSLDEINPRIVLAARRAINAALDKGRTLSAREIRAQVNFPASYLQGADSRLTVSQRATDTRLEGVIRGRRRPTSLARFVSGSQSKKGVNVEVKPGHRVHMKRAFLMKLKRGNAALGTLHNVGLAVRTKKGQRPDRAYKPYKVAEDLYLLYGPSVEQVFKSVREQVAPDVEAFLATEFNRLLDLDI